MAHPSALNQTHEMTRAWKDCADAVCPMTHVAASMVAPSSSGAATLAGDKEPHELLWDFAVLRTRTFPSTLR